MDAPLIKTEARTRRGKSKPMNQPVSKSVLEPLPAHEMGSFHARYESHTPIIDTYSGIYNKKLPLLHFRGEVKDLIRMNRK